MTFAASIPLATDSPALFPTQSQSNFQVLNTIISEDHQFNNTPVGGDNSGYHKLIHMIMPNPAPTVGIASTGQLYTKTVDSLVQLHYMDDAGTEYQITPDSANSSGAARGTVTTLNAPVTIFLGSVVPNYTGILTVIKTGSSDGFKTFTLYKDAFGDNSSRINSSGSSFSCLISYTGGGDLQITVDSIVYWTLNWVKI